MARINERHGGARPNSGPRPKAERMGLEALLDKCWTTADREKCIRALAKTANNPLSNNRVEAVKILMGYTFGRPTERHELTGKDGEDLLRQITVVVKKQ